jgi:hypothetical protein
MTELKRLRCDRCGTETANDSKQPRRTGWALCMVGFERWDFCPECWRVMRARENAERLDEAIAEIEAGQVTEFDPTDPANEERR